MVVIKIKPDERFEFKNTLLLASDQMPVKKPDIRDMGGWAGSVPLCVGEQVVL